MKFKTLFLSLVHIFTYRQSYQQVDPDICFGIGLYDVHNSHQGIKDLSIDDCVTLCKQNLTCDAVSFYYYETDSACFLFKPNRDTYNMLYGKRWVSWFKGKTPSGCQKLDSKIPEVGKVYTVTNYFGCLMELNDGCIYRGNEIVVSTDYGIPFANSQQWYIKPVLATPHVYQIINYQSQMALDITDSKLRQQIPLSTSKNQHFSFSIGMYSSVLIHSLSNGKVLSNVDMTKYCLSKAYIQQDLQRGFYDQLWFFKEVNLTTNDTSLHITMTNNTISTPVPKKMLTFLDPESCEFPMEGKYYCIVNRYQCAMDLQEGQTCSGNLITTYVNYNDSTINCNLWYIEKIKTSENTYQIINANSSLALVSNGNILRQQISLKTVIQQHYTFSFGTECSIYIHAGLNPNMVLSNDVTSPNCESKAAILLQLKDNSTNQQWYFKETKSKFIFVRKRVKDRDENIYYFSEFSSSNTLKEYDIASGIFRFFA